MKDQIAESIFYHIYPLGACGAPQKNDFCSQPVNRLAGLTQWIPHMKEMGVNALYLGPVFESEEHGYDGIDLYKVDRRLGTNDSLIKFIEAMHQNDIKVVLDGVFHHVGRSFFAFEDVCENLRNSKYCDWFSGLDFSQGSPYGDSFAYEAWDGNFNLVKLNLNNHEVRDYIFGAIKKWIKEFGIDGIRLDAADALDLGFIKDLAGFARGIKSDIWLMGEVIHGDYSRWANAGMLDSTTNYECYKGLFSSHNDCNYHEIAHSLNRQFGRSGIYEGKYLYNFVDNHDVNRVASILNDESHLYPLYGILFTMPGIPSLYYGSEWGIKGEKKDGSDEQLRPELSREWLKKNSEHYELKEAIKRFVRCRKQSKALKYGDYQEVHVAHQQLVFQREYGGESVIVAVNSAYEEVRVEVPVQGEQYFDLLNNNTVKSEEGSLSIKIPPCWLCILTKKDDS